MADDEHTESERAETRYLIRAAVALAVAGAGIAALVWMSPASAQDQPSLSPTRGFERGGPYASQWSAPATGGNTAIHQGRGTGTFEDAGRGTISFEVRADARGRATVAFEDVADTRNFASFTVNGEKIDVPAPARDGGILRVALDFGRAGWHRVVAATTLRPGLPASRQDGFGAVRGACK